MVGYPNLFLGQHRYVVVTNRADNTIVLKVLIATVIEIEVSWEPQAKTVGTVTATVHVGRTMSCMCNASPVANVLCMSCLQAKQRLILP